MKDLEKTISDAFDEKPTVSPKEISEAVTLTMKGLNNGSLRVSTHDGKGWTTHVWLKQAILLYFKSQKISEIKSGDLNFFDKIPLKKWTGDEGVRVVPHALVRYGAFVESDSRASTPGLPR